MISEAYEALAAPPSAERFATAMQEIAESEGADRFLVLKLQGLAKRELAEVIHNGGSAVDRLLGHPRDLVFDRLTMALSLNGPSLMIGPGSYALPMDGYANGAATINRDKRFGCVVVFARESAIGDDERMGMLAAAALAATMALAGFNCAPAKACTLTDRELECLRFYVAGVSPKATAAALEISARTVEGHLKQARMRCAVDNTLAAAMMALNEGWIEPSDIRRLAAG
ncbi:MAG TPA: helix-turn-helix domain-containing protein [Roseateles sp.]|uniref:response regulator transcription factor n=1 Tax=Roseateles sp. TaxID=1971397 RepID=UPI002EDA4F28